MSSSSSSRKGIEMMLLIVAYTERMHWHLRLYICVHVLSTSSYYVDILKQNDTRRSTLKKDKETEREVLILFYSSRDQFYRW